MAPATQWKVKGSEPEKSTGKAKSEEKGADDRGKGKRKGGGGKGEPQKGRDDDWHEEGAGGGKKGGKGKGGRKGEKGKDGGRGGKEGRDGGRSALSSAAPNFEPAGGYGGYGGYDDASGYWGWSAGVPPLPLWREYADTDGTPYYYNSKTGLCQWERPAELEPSKAGHAGEAADAAAEKGGREGGDRGDRGARDGRGGDRDGDRARRDPGERRDSGKGSGKGGKGDRDRGGGGGGDAEGDRRGRRKGKPEEDAKKKEVSEFGPPGCNLFVFHLPDDWTDDDLHEYFAPHGQVVSAKVMKELGTGRSRGFGFVSYEDRVSAATAIKKMQGYKILGKRLKVEFKKGEGENSKEFEDDRDEEDAGGAKKSIPDDERLIGYLRAISAKNVVQSLRESEDADRGEGGDEDGDGGAAAADEGDD